MQNCTETYSDISDPATVNALFVLAAINLVVIVMGVYTCNLRLQNDHDDQKFKTLLFYFTALSCLLVAEVYFITGRNQFQYCGQNFLQTYPAFAYLLTGYTYLTKSLEVVKIDRLAQTNKESDKSRILRRYKWRMFAVCSIIACLIFMYVLIEVNYCNHQNDGTAPYMWTGTFYSITYYFTLIVMLFGWSHEYAVMKRFKQNHPIPARNLLITSFIFCLSYSVRAVFNTYVAMNGDQMANFQQRSCQKQAADLGGGFGWAILVFFIHFLGEVLPLFVLFYMQSTMYKTELKARDETNSKQDMLSDQLTDGRFTLAQQNDLSDKQTIVQHSDTYSDESGIQQSQPNDTGFGDILSGNFEQLKKQLKPQESPRSPNTMRRSQLVRTSFLEAEDQANQILLHCDQQQSISMPRQGLFGSLNDETFNPNY